MPCFLVGISHATLLAQALQVPLVEVSHQQVVPAQVPVGILQLVRRQADERRLRWGRFLLGRFLDHRIPVLQGALPGPVFHGEYAGGQQGQEKVSRAEQG